MLNEARSLFGGAGLFHAPWLLTPRDCYGNLPLLERREPMVVLGFLTGFGLTAVWLFVWFSVARLILVGFGDIDRWWSFPAYMTAVILWVGAGFFVLACTIGVGMHVGGGA
jgi:hypothetical protein